MELRKVDKQNIWKLVHLSVSEDQQNFVASNTQSILEAYTTITNGGVALPFGIYDGEMPVGFVMLGYGVNDPDDPPEADGNYCLWRFMIDRNFQRRGYGKRAMALVLDYVKTYPCGPAKLCWLSYEPENEAAKALYHRFGFRETGGYCGDEIVAVLPL